MPTAFSRRISAGVVAFALAAAGTLVASPALAAVTLDPVPLTPSSGTVTADRTPAFDWQAGDGTHWTFRHRVEVLSGSTAVRYGILQGDTSWSPLIPLPDGDYTWRVAGVEGLNDLGAWSTAVPFSVDTVAPDVTLTSPASGTFGGGGLTIAGTVADAHPATVQLFDDGVLVQTDSSGAGTFSFTYAPPTGSRTLTVTATDAAGNSDAGSSASVAVTIDADAPSVVILSPSAGSYVKLGDPVDFHATATDAHRFSWNGRLDGAGIPGAYQYLATGPVEYRTSIATTGWLDGSTHTFSFSTRDEFDQTSAATAKVTADGTAPVVTFAAPASDTTHAGVLTVSGTVTDTGSGVGSLDVRVRAANDAGVCNGPSQRFDVVVGAGGAWTIDIDTTQFPDGVYCVISHAEDNVGNGNGQSTRLRGIEFDNTAPAGTLAPVFPQGFTLAAERFEWTALSDPNGVTYEVALGNHPNVDLDGLMTSGLVLLGATSSTTLPHVSPTGPAFWQVRAVDSLGNATPWTAPTGYQVIGVPTVLYPTPGLEFSATSLTAQWSPSFGVGGVDHYELRYGLDRDHDGTLEYETRTAPGHSGWPVGTQSRTQNFTSGYEGPLTLEVRAIYEYPIGGSTVGPWSSPAVSYLRDTGKPTVTIDTPVAGTVVKSDAALPVTVTGVDPAGITRLVANLYAADGTTLLGPIGSTATGSYGQTATRTWNIPAGLAEGEYVIRASARDTAGKTTATSVSFVVDRTRPTVTIDVPADGALLASDVTVTVTGLDPNGIRSIAASLYGADNTGPLLRAIGQSTAPSGASTHTATWTIPASWFTADGTYTIRAGGFDAAGNNRTVTARFTLDTTAPATPQPINPENGRMQANDAPVLDWQPLADAVSYEVRTSRSPGRTPNVNDGELNGSDAATVPASTDELALSGLADGWLWWQVRAIDAAGNVGPWSNIWATGVDTTAPVVALTSPADGAVLTSGDFTLQWTAPESGLTFDVRSSIDPATDPASGELLGTTGGGQTSVAVNELDLVGVPEQTYYWQVRATDAVGNVGPWTAPWSVTVDLPTLAVPPTEAGTPGTSGTPGLGGTGGAGGTEPTDLTTFALTEEPDEPADDDGDTDANTGGGSTGADPESTSSTAPVDTGMIALLVGLAAAMLLLLVVFLAWLRRRQTT